MSKITLAPDVSGTGTFTIAAPNGNTDRTLTLPDNSGTVFTNAGGTMTGALALPAGGLNVGSGQLAVDASGRVTMSAQPAFDAVLTTTAGSVQFTTGNTAIVFNATNLNRGGHYNTANGRFTAPVAGVYWFSMTGMTTVTTWYELRVNGAVLAQKHAPYSTNNGTYWSLSSSSWAISLNAADYVQIFTGNAGSGIYGGGNNHNNFSGFLIG